MADIAILDGPGYLAIVAGPAILAIDNFQHVNLVATGLHLETEVGMANLAPETDAMKPMGENHGPHAGRIGVIIHQHVTILGNHYRRHR
jgi:hypothetical protein